MKNILVALLPALLASGCAPRGGYTLTGQVPQAWEAKPVVLYTTDTGEARAVDSTTISDGRFRLHGTFDMPRNCRVAVYLDPENRQDRNLTVTFPLFLDSTAVHAVCDAAQQQPVFTLSGGSTQTEWQEYLAALEPLSDARKQAFDDYVEAFYRQGDTRRGPELAMEVTRKAARLREARIDYIRRNPASAVSLAVLQELCDSNSELTRAQMDELFAALAPRLQNSEAGRYTQRLIRDKRMINGSPLPDIEVLDREGRIRKVSDFIRPGRHTLVEVWASWCMPCRGEIPFVKRAYDKYHKRGFDVVYISIDSREENWRQALGEEKMPWPQLLDTPRRSFEAYETTAVPTSILIDPDGRILSLNARGGWLDAALESIYGI